MRPMQMPLAQCAAAIARCLPMHLPVPAPAGGVRESIRRGCDHQPLPRPGHEPKARGRGGLPAQRTNARSDRRSNRDLDRSTRSAAPDPDVQHRCTGVGDHRRSRGRRCAGPYVKHPSARQGAQAALVAAVEDRCQGRARLAPREPTATGRSTVAAAPRRQADDASERCPGGHFKFPHLWPLKFPRQDGADYGLSVPVGVDSDVRGGGGLLEVGSVSGLARGSVAEGVVVLLFQSAVGASEARQAGGIGRGAVVKSRTPQGPSTGWSCGRVACPPRARVACSRWGRRP